MPAEAPWVWWRLGLLDSDQGLVGPLGSGERLLELCGWDVAAVAVQAGGVVPVDPAKPTIIRLQSPRGGAPSR